MLSTFLDFRESVSVFSLLSPAPPAPSPAGPTGISAPLPEAKASEERFHLSVVLFGLDGVLFCFVFFFPFFKLSHFFKAEVFIDKCRLLGSL